MKDQEIYSLAIFALNELKQGAKWSSLIRDCDKAIERLEEMKSINQVLTNCTDSFDIQITNNDCGTP